MDPTFSRLLELPAVLDPTCSMSTQELVLELPFPSLTLAVARSAMDDLCKKNNLDGSPKVWRKGGQC